MSDRLELLALTRELRRRVEGSHESDCAASVAVAPGKAKAFAALAKAVEACRQCPLGQHRLHSVFGVGSPEAEVMFVGEGPGFDEDHKGEPFIGRSGQLLDKIMASIGLSRQNSYIANIVKCHPMKNPADPEARGNDRPPTPEEMTACHPYLDQQIALIRPKFIVTLGAVAAKVLLKNEEPISRVRGQWSEYRIDDAGLSVRLLPTYHPAALLRNPALKKDVWTDMKNLKKELEAS
jgi:DNA polymerase